MKINTFRCFGMSQKQGSIALVVCDSMFFDDEKLSFTKIKNVPVCVFVEQIDSADIFVDFYYPHRQSPLCLHGAFAVACLYFKLCPAESVCRRTRRSR